MLDPSAILRLYDKVLSQQYSREKITNSCVFDRQIKTAIKKMYVVYSPETTDFESNVPETADYNDVAYRCAYLHKYAPLHTYIVCDAMTKVLKQEMLLFQELLKNPFKMCCLGGGPGSDVIGVLDALQSEFGHFKSSATMIDCMENWKITFAGVFQELMVGKGYGRAWKKHAKHFEWHYIGADLLRDLTRSDVHQSIASSNLVTMVKFLSAAICRNTECMVQVIFKNMKPGALLLFIDNAGGGFSQLIQKVAQANGLVILFSLQHVPYSQEAFKVIKFGFASCWSTTVTIILLQKQITLLQKQITHLSKRKPKISPNNSADEKTPLLNEKKKRKASCLEQEVTRVSNSWRNTPLSPNAENIPKLHHDFRPKEEILERNEKLSWRSVHLSTNPEQLPKLTIKQDIIFQHSTLKSSPLVFGRNCAVENSLTDPQSASNGTNLNAPAYSNPVVTRNKLENLGKSEYVSSEQSKLNTKGQGISFKTPLSQIEDKEVCHSLKSKQIEKKMPSTSTSSSPMRNSQEDYVETKVVQKKGTLGTESSQRLPVRNSCTNYSLIITQPVSGAGPSHTTESRRHSKLNATRNGVDYTEVKICCPCCVPSSTPNLPQERSNSSEEEVCCPACVLS